MLINDLITDDELEQCFEGSTNIDMVREIIDEVEHRGLLDVERFAQLFADEIEPFIDAEPDTTEHDEAYNNNYDWGMMIAENINDFMRNKS